MGTRDPRIDPYIARAPEFARPILSHLREVVHHACPEVEEAMKWSTPHFTWRGMLCHMAAFKQHCAFGFWKGSLVVGDGNGAASEAMGQFGRITSLADLPPDDVLAGYVHEAMRLNEEGVKPPARTKPAEKKKELEVPDDLTAALQANPAALAHFEGFSPSKRKEYVEWITEAKTEATRAKRLGTAVEWIAEGKARHWKYEKC
ncbi:MAG: YdeI/OmpD-associated family protein [Longimicrobiaceae bacterium]